MIMTYNCLSFLFSVLIIWSKMNADGDKRRGVDLSDFLHGHFCFKI